MKIKSPKQALNNNFNYFLFILNKIFFPILFITFSIATLNAQWEACNNGLGGAEVWNFIANGNTIFAAVDGDVFMTSDNGNHWIDKNNGLKDLHVEALAINGNNINAGTYSGLFLSTDNGDNWKIIAFKDTMIDVIYIYGNYIFSDGLGICFSTDYGNNWIKIGYGLTISDINSLIINGNYIYGASTFHGIFRAKLSDLGITDVKEEHNNISNAYFGIYPNPASSSVRVKYESSSYSKLQISIFDFLGNEVFNTSEDCNIGMNEKVIDCRSLETGYYIIRLKQGERVETKPFIKITNY